MPIIGICENHQPCRSESGGRVKGFMTELNYILHNIKHLAIVPDGVDNGQIAENFASFYKKVKNEILLTNGGKCCSVCGTIKQSVDLAMSHYIDKHINKEPEKVKKVFKALKEAFESKKKIINGADEMEVDDDLDMDNISVYSKSSYKSVSGSRSSSSAVKPTPFMDLDEKWDDDDDDDSSNTPFPEFSTYRVSHPTASMADYLREKTKWQNRNSRK